MISQEGTKIGNLEPCKNRTGKEHNGRFVMSCGGFEVLPDECIGCNGTIKKKMSLRQLLTQKSKELNMILNRKNQLVKPMTDEDILDRLDRASVMLRRIK